MKNIKMIVTDLDGTLISDDKNNRLSNYSVQVLKNLQKRGILLTFATSRPQRSLKMFRGELCPNFFIANNGATIYRGDELIKNIVIDKIFVDEIIAKSLENEKITAISIEGGEHIFNDFHDFSLEQENWNCEYFDFTKEFNFDVPKISLECSDLALLEEIIGKFPNLHMYPNSGENWVQIMDRESTKFNAIKHICALSGIDTDDVIAFGNDYNDVEMLKECRIGVATENAAQDAKSAANYICGGNNCGGVAKWIDENLLIL